jgi:hypothetical protein
MKGLLISFKGGHHICFVYFFIKIMQSSAGGHLDFGVLQHHLNLNKSIQFFAGTSVSI